MGLDIYIPFNTNIFIFIMIVPKLVGWVKLCTYLGLTYLKILFILN